MKNEPSKMKGQKGTGVSIVNHKQDRSVSAQLERNTGRGAKRTNRQINARVRKAERDQRSAEEQLEVIKSYPGNCAKETARLQKQIRLKNENKKAA